MTIARSFLCRALAAFVMLSSIFITQDVLAAVTVTPGSGGVGISADKAANGSNIWTTLGTITIAENTSTDFSTQTATTLILTAPSGWKFNAGVGSVNHQNGRDLSSSSLSVSATTITVTITVSGTTKMDTLNIVGIQAQALDGAAIPSSGTILRLAGNPGTATINGITNGTTSFGSLSQVAGLPKALAMQTQPSSSVSAGVAFAQQPQIRITDRFGNLVSTNLTISVSRGAGSGTLQGTTSVAASGGVATFSGLNHQVATTINLVFTNTVIAAGVTSDNIVVSPAAATALTFTAQPGSALAGSPFVTQPVVRSRDAFGNNSSVGLGASLALTMSLPAPSGSLLGTTSIDIGTAAGNGVATFTDLRIDSVGSKQLTASASGLTSATSSSFIVQAPTVVAAASQSATYSASAQSVALSASVAGVNTPSSVNEGTVTFQVKQGATLVGSAVTSSTVAAGSASVSYALPAGTVAGSYTIVATYNNGPDFLGSSDSSATLTIAQASQSISFAALPARTYGDAPFTLSATASSGLSVSFSILSGPATLSGNAVTITAVGSVTIRASQSGNANYVAADPIDRTFVVSPAALSVTANSTSRAYGASNPTFTGNIVGIVNGDNISATYASAATADSPVGSYPITPTLVDPNGKAANYTVNLVNGTLTVAPAPLTVTAADLSRAYATPNPTLSGNILGLVNGDNITATYSTSVDVGSAVGSYAIVPALVDPENKAGNYSVNLVNGTLTVVAVPLTITANNASRLYGAANPSFDGTIVGLVNGDTITATYDSSAVATSPVGTYSIVPTVVDPNGKAGNYAVTLVNGTLTVTPVLLTGTADDKSRAYGQTNPVFTVSYSGFVNNEDASIVTGELIGSTTAETNSPIGTYPISVSGQSAPNYTIQYVDGTLTVTPYALTVKADDKSKIYGQADPSFTVTYTGFVNGDTESSLGGTLSLSRQPGESVGSYTITASGLTSSNYAISFATGTLTINKAALSVTAADATRMYGDANPVFTGTLTGVQAGDNITASYASSADASSPIGNYPIVPTLQDPDSKLSNYEVTINNGTLSVTKAPLIVNVDSASRLYGAANPEFSGSITGIRNSDDITASYGTTATAASSVGNYPITASLNDPGSKLGNYEVTINNGTLTINPAPLSVSAVNKSRSYGGADPEFTGSIVGIQNADNLTLSFSSSATVTSPVGNYDIVPSINDPAGKLGNYTVSSANGTLSVTPVLLTGTADDKNRTYGQTNPVFTVSYSGFVNNEDASIVTGELIGSTTAETNSPIGTYPISVSGQSAPNYTIQYVDGTLTVTPYALTVKADDKSKIYGQADPTFTVSYTGFVDGDDESSLTGALALTRQPGESAGTYTVTPSGLTSLKYTITFATGTLTINKAALSVTAADATRMYGDANPVFTGTLTGVQAGDNITASYASSADASSPIGNYPIVPTLQDPDSKLSNYEVTINNGTLSVTKAPLIVNVDSVSRLYGAANPEFSGSISGIRNSDDITASYSTTATPASSVGSYPITASLNDPGSKLSNYEVTINNGTLSVTKAPLTVNVDSASRLYGAANPEFSGSISGIRNTDAITASYNTTATPANSVGNYAITASLNDPGSKLGNYEVTINNGTLTINPVPLSVSAVNKSRAYGAANPEFTGAIAGIQNGDNLTLSFSTSATATSPVGNYDIVPSINDPAGKLGNYTVSSANGALTINPALLTGTSDDKSRAYGQTNPVFTVSYSGFVNNEDASIVTGELIGSTTAETNSPIGTYPISVSGQSAPNYTIQYVDGTLTVTPYALTVKADDKSKIYGQADPSFTVTYTGFVNGDTESSLGGTLSLSRQPGESVGSYTITASGLTSSNYAISFATGTLTINKAALNVTAADATRMYGDANPVFTGTLTGVQAGDNITASYASGADASSPIGNYPIVPTLQDPDSKLSNYEVTINNGTLSVTKAPLTVNVDSASRLYGAANPEFSGSITGIRNSDDITASYGTTATAASSVGNYPITASLNDPGSKLGNYEVTINNGTLTINPAPLSVSAVNKSRAYGAANPEFTGAIAGIQNGDNLTLSFSSSATVTSPVGNYDIVPSINDPAGKLGNYTVSSANGTLTINPALLTGTADDKSRAYGQTNPVFTVSYSGFVNNEDAGIVTGELIGSTTAETNSPIGTYPISVSGQSAPNYTIQYVDGTLTVTPYALTVKADDKSKIYGQADPSFTVTYAGFVNGDTESSLGGTLSLSRQPGESVGSYTITTSGLTSSNYAISFATGTLTINKAALNVTAADATRMYGDANPVFTGTLTGVQAGDNITASYASGADVSSPIGNYPIVPTLQDPDSKLSNYDVTINNGTLSVTKAPLTVAVDNASRVYGATDPVFSGTISGIRNSDDITANYSTTATAASSVGNYAITASLNDSGSKLGNYEVTISNGILTVLEAELTITADDFTRGVGSPNPTFTGTIVGLQNGDNISATYSSDATQESPIGFYAIIPSPVDPQGKLGNYSLSIDIGILTIRAAGVTAIAWLENGHAHITGAGDAGVNYSIEASSDLTTWSPVATVTADQNGTLEFEDSDASQFPNRFYRAVLSH